MGGLRLAFYMSLIEGFNKMASFNRVILVGNLTHDPDVRFTPSGTSVAEIGLAVNRYWFDKGTNERKEETTFVDVTLWGKQAEIAKEYLRKGRLVLVEGRLQTDSWEDKETGRRKTRLKVVGEMVRYLDRSGNPPQSPSVSGEMPAVEDPF